MNILTIRRNHSRCPYTKKNAITPCIVLAAILLSFCRCNPLRAIDANDVCTRIDTLIKNGKFEAGAAYILEQLPASTNQSLLSLKMSQIELKRANPQSAFAYFARAINALPSKSSSEVLQPDIERMLNIAALFRLHKVLPVASSILSALQEKHQQYSSIKYELANFYVTKDSYSDFFENYYTACQLNPDNPRALPGRAILKTITSPKPPAPQDFPWLAVAVEYYDNPLI